MKKKIVYTLLILSLFFLNLRVNALSYFDNYIFNIYKNEYVNNYIDIEVPQELIDEYENYTHSSEYEEATKEFEESITNASISDEKYSSVDAGYVTSVKNQMSTGSCWAHAGMSILETAAIKEGKATTNLDLSEMHLVYSTNAQAFSDKTIKNRFYLGGPLSSKNNGGNIIMTASYMFSGLGAVENKLFPLKSYSSYKDGEVVPVDSSGKEKQITTQEFATIDSTPQFYVNDFYRAYGNSKSCYSSVNDMKKMILNYGSVQATINWDNSYVHNSYYFINNSATTTNHAITLVGWDDTIEASKFGLSDESKKGAWIMKNSWGTSRGNKGYYYVSYYDYTICTNVATFSGIDNNNYDYVYDSTGMYYASALYGLTNSSVYQASVFTKEGTSEYLEKVSFAVNPGYSYIVYYAPYADGTWKTNQSSWVNLGSIKSSDVNYYGIKSLSTKSSNIKIADKYVIVVKGTKPDTSPYNYASITYKDKVYTKNTISTTKMELIQDENYYSTNGSSWTDLYDYSYEMDVPCMGDVPEGSVCKYTSKSTYDGAQNIIYAYTKEEVVEITPTIINSNNETVDNFYSFDDSKYNLSIKDYIGNNKVTILNSINEDYTSYFDVNVDNTNNRILISTKSGKYIPVGQYSLTINYANDNSTTYQYKIISTLNVSKPFEIDKLSIPTTDGLIYTDTAFDVLLKNYANTLTNDNLTYVVKNGDKVLTDKFNISYDKGKVTIKAKELVDEGTYNLSISINNHDTESINFDLQKTYVMNYTPKESNLVIEPSDTTQGLTTEDVKKNISSVYGYTFLDSEDKEINPEYIGTGMKLKINISASEYKVYSFILMGDVTGDGVVSLGDVAALYNHYRGNKLLAGAFLSAGKTTGNDEIALGDVSKLYNFYRGKKGW